MVPVVAQQSYRQTLDYTALTKLVFPYLTHCCGTSKSDFDENFDCLSPQSHLSIAAYREITTTSGYMSHPYNMWQQGGGNIPAEKEFAASSL